ncbi:MAG TPA: BON domain-containing protein [Xanthomonadaceae bacterium]|nr:BON domain-containing protein [Xanthomonadaceae bacterium]
MSRPRALPGLLAAACLLLAAACPALARDAPRADIPRDAPLPAPPAAAAPAAPVASQVAAEVKAGRREDERIAAAVAARLLRQPNLQDVTVTVNAGVATLSGEALGESDRQRAAALAQQVDGVAEVVNQIRLSSDLRARFDAAMRETRGKFVRAAAALPLLAIAILVVLLAWWLGRRLSRRPARWLRGRSHNPYMEGLVRRAVRTVIVLVGVLLALDLLGATTLVGAVLGSAGVVGLVLGFAFKDIAENYVAGILLSLRRPFAPGDHLLIDKYDGKVVALTSRATLLMTLDGNQVALPNATVFKSVVTNYSQNPRRRFDFLLPLDPSACVPDAQRAAAAAIASVDGVLAEPGPYVLVGEVLHDRINLQVLAWMDQRSHDLKRVRSEALRLAAAALDHAGIRRAGVPLPSPGSMQPARTEPPPASADTTVDRAIEPQLEQAQREQQDANLLEPAPGAAAP